MTRFKVKTGKWRDRLASTASLLSAGNSNAGYYFTPSGNNANRPKLIDRDGGSAPGFALNFTGGQGLFTKGLNAQEWNGME